MTSLKDPCSAAAAVHTISTCKRHQLVWGSTVHSSLRSRTTFQFQGYQTAFVQFNLKGVLMNQDKTGAIVISIVHENRLKVT